MILNTNDGCMHRFRRLLRLAGLGTIAVALAACGSSEPSSSTSSAAAGGGAAVTIDAGGDNLDGGFPPTETPVKGGVLKAAMVEDIDCWSGLSYYGLSWSVFSFMARGLYGYPNTVTSPATDALVPELAADMPRVSADGLSYSVTLREGLVFPDGSPVTAKDVKATFEHILDPTIQCSTGGPPASGYYDGIVGATEYIDELQRSDGTSAIGIRGIKVVDDVTTSFTLTEADASFPRALAMGWAFIIPAGTPREQVKTPPPFVGPYMISEYQAGASLTIERQPRWRENVAAGVPQAANENNIDGIAVRIGVPADTQFLQLKANELDLTLDGSAPRGSQIRAVAGNPQFRDRFFSTPDAAIDYAVFRANTAPFDDVRLRQAVNFAIDREALVRTLGGKLGRSPWSQMLPRNLLADQPTDVYTLNVSRARRLVAAAGAETPIAITLVGSSEWPGPQQATAIKTALEAVGFAVTVRLLSAASLYGYLADPDSDYHVGIAGWSEDYADAMTYFGPLVQCGQGANYGQFCDSEVDARIAAINQLPPGDDRTAQFAQLSTDTARAAAPWAVLDLRRRVSFVSRRLGNYVWGPGKQFYFASYFLRDGR
jgi:ABC-type transport system substrate-binding protein